MGIQTQQPPHRVTVEALLSSRYGKEGGRPLSWDARMEGVDRVRTSEGDEVLLISDGQQSAPQPGWTILLTQGVSVEGSEGECAYTWTLYGLS
jgi:hypothetical protein